MSSARKRQKSMRVSLKQELYESRIRSLEGQLRLYRGALDIFSDKYNTLYSAAREVVEQCGIFNMIDYPASVSDALSVLEDIIVGDTNNDAGARKIISAGYEGEQK